MTLPFFALAACLVRLGPGTDLTIDNLQPGELVRNPVVIVRGSADGPDMVIGRTWDSAIRFPVVNHRYSAFVELKPGINMVVLNSKTETMKFRLDYRPMSTPFKLEACIVTAADQSETEYATNPRTLFPVREKVDTAMKLLQALVADAMSQAGYGRKTFALELDKDGKVAVHFLKEARPRGELDALESGARDTQICDLLASQLPDPAARRLALVGFGRDAPAGPVLANLASGRSGPVLFSESVLLGWPATLRDLNKVSATAEAFNALFLPSAARAVGPPLEAPRWDPLLTAELNYDPWLQPDGNHGAPFDASPPPTVRFDGDDVVIDAPAGIRVIGAEATGLPPWLTEYKAADPPRRLKLSRRDLRSKLQDTKSPLTIVVTDDHGSRAEIQDR